MASRGLRNALQTWVALNTKSKWTLDQSVVPPFRIGPARTKQDLEIAAKLFATYAASLPVDLEYQGFEFELAELPGKYSAPEGELLIAWDALERPVGCVALRPLDTRDKCEMKRLYVLLHARSFGLGGILTEAIVAAARSRGYSELFLDTLPTMGAAAALYERIGFHRTGAYYGPTLPGTIFMKLELRGEDLQLL